jgi:hypothetical protein
MIDVHILTMPSDNPIWFDQCMESLKNEPVKVHVRDGVENDIGNARADAFMLGDSEYVSFVDPDDYVLPGGFAACLDAIKSDGSEAAYTYEIKTGISGEMLKHPYVLRWAHHLIVIKKAVVLQNINLFRDWRWPSRFSEGRMFVDFLLASGKRVSLVDKPYYVWRRHSDSYTIKYQTSVKNG